LPAPNGVAFRRPRSAIFRSPLQAFETFLPWEDSVEFWAGRTRCL